MTPDERNKLNEIYEWVQRKKLQQIDLPLDEQSKNIIGIVTTEGTGATALTQNINLTGEAQSITVPKAYSDTIIIKIGTTRYEIPYLSLP